jgi:hypothetical protein
MEALESARRPHSLIQPMRLDIVKVLFDDMLLHYDVAAVSSSTARSPQKPDGALPDVQTQGCVNKPHCRAAGSKATADIGVVGALSIGIGGIIGGGFFATFGLAVVGARGSTYLGAF